MKMSHQDKYSWKVANDKIILKFKFGEKKNSILALSVHEILSGFLEVMLQNCFKKLSPAMLQSTPT